MSMFDLIHRRARLSPNRLALEDLHDGTRYTYQQLNTRAAQFAAAATEHWQLQEGERVAYLGHNRAEFFVLWFGCAKAGLVLVPLNWRLAVPELMQVLADAQPKVLIYGQEFESTAQTLAQQHTPLLLVGLDAGCTGRSYHNDLAQTQPSLQAHASRSADTPWYLLYTSGTTGRPKGVIQTFRMLEANFSNIGLATALNQDDVLLNVLPMFHTAGINLYSSCMFWVGGTVLVQRHFDAAAALQVLGTRATVFFAVPAIYQALADSPEFHPPALSRVRSWGCGGAAMPTALLQHYAQQGIAIRCGMGMTETGPTVFLMDAGQGLVKPGSVGRPQLCTEVQVVDREGRILPPGIPGELWIRGPGVTPGYWQMPDATAAAFSADGWFRSGDVVVYDEDGDYTIVDRWKDMYISGGENVFPAEVEAVLLRHPAVAEVAVIGVPDARWGEVGHAFLVAAADAEPPDSAALRLWCRDALAGYKIPHHFSWCTALPRNALGKVVKQELRHALS